ncbi:MAG: hypothetical protein LBF54_04270 [Holosporaceae bacterium]|jgi:hypothetical protein|nr:hypothetical protein [Holosporaceae bacterium]
MTFFESRQEDFNMFEQTARPANLSTNDKGQNDAKGGGHTPQYTITCPDIFGSDLGEIDGNDASADTSPIIWIVLGSARLATYDSSGELSGDGRIVCRDIIICMKYGGWAPVIQQYMYEGKKIDKITVKRLISINGTLIVIQEITYETCLFKTYEQNGDTITFTFTFVKYTDLSKAYGHDGTAIGNVGVTFDYGSVKVESISG